jgi:uncharacterized protein YlxW (UPF0749 family)
MRQSEKTEKVKVNDRSEHRVKDSAAPLTPNYLLIRLVLLLACVLLGYLAMSQYKSLQKTPEEKFIDGKTTSELSNDYITLYDKYTALLARNEQLTQNVSSLEAAKNGDTELQTILKDEAEEAGRQAGTLPVTGNGISVVITPDEEVPITSNMLIQFVNEIKAADALAISVNDQRVVPMTEMRDTVSGFSVNGEQFSYANPITILAVGNGVDMYSALQMVGGVLDKWEQSHINVHVDIQDNLTVPALGEKQQEKMDLSSFSVPQTTLSPTPNITQ